MLAGKFARCKFFVCKGELVLRHKSVVSRRTGRAGGSVLKSSKNVSVAFLKEHFFDARAVDEERHRQRRGEWRTLERVERTFGAASLFQPTRK